MKRIEKFIFILSLIIGISMFLYSCKQSKQTRIRIIAKDNLTESINFKYQLKEEVLSLLSKIAYLEENELVNYLQEELYPKYSNITISFKNDTYPAKTINHKIVPSGVYPTILIEVGDAKGSNWWSILYPEYFNLDYEDSNEVEYRSYFYDLFNNSKS